MTEPDDITRAETDPVKAQAAVIQAARQPPNRPARFVMAGTFLAAGVVHFVAPSFFEAIIPEEIPQKRLWVYATGVAELAGGAGLLLRPSRKLGWALVALLVLVFPANVNQALRDVAVEGAPAPPRWALFLRLPLQALMIWAVLAATREATSDR